MFALSQPDRGNSVPPPNQPPLAVFDVTGLTYIRKKSIPWQYQDCKGFFGACAEVKNLLTDDTYYQNDTLKSVSDYIGHLFS
jgi:hypothetical protein